MGEASNGKEAIAQLATLSVDVVLMDVRMPVMDGVAATKAIRQKFPEVKILVLTTFDDDEYVVKSLQYGALGYLLKDTPPDDLIQAIHSAAKGYTQLAPGLMPRLIKPEVDSPPPPLGWEELTPREKEILRLIAQGKNNQEIGQELYIAEKTVKNHFTRILNRLNLRDRLQAALVAKTQQDLGNL